MTDIDQDNTPTTTVHHQTTGTTATGAANNSSANAQATSKTSTAQTNTATTTTANTADTASTTNTTNTANTTATTAMPKASGTSASNAKVNAASTTASTTSAAATKASQKKKSFHDIELIVCWVLFAVTIVLNTLADFGVLFKPDYGDSASAVFAWFVPSDYTKLIWIPIYVLVAIWLIRMGNTKSKGTGFKAEAKNPFMVMGILFALVMLVDLGWVIAWSARNYPLGILAAVVCTALIAVLDYMSRRNDKTIWGWIPFTLFGSWMLVQSVCDIFRGVVYYVSKDHTISDVVQGISSIVLVVLLLLLGMFLKIRMHNWIFSVVVLWSTLGIATRLMDVSQPFGIALIVIGTIAAVLTYVPWHKIAHGIDKFDKKDSNAAQPKAKAAKPTK